MKLSVILGHPSTKSLNRAIADTVVQTLTENGHDARFHDLYQENFDPALSLTEVSPNSELDPMLQQHCDELGSAEGLVIIHPVWWGQPPAILKGWIDRVFRVGIAYRFDEGPAGVGMPVGLLKTQSALLINTSNTPPDLEEQIYGNSLAELWHRNVLGFCGIKNFYRRLYSPVLISTPEQRENWLNDAQQTVDQLYPKMRTMRATA
ncbi:MAG TPA: NAD(P)H-dependent oxidoreductase [Candidatus Aquicultor sp.]|jgi:putative NADPH-quinone reductase